MPTRNSFRILTSVLPLLLLPAVAWSGPELGPGESATLGSGSSEGGGRQCRVLEDATRDCDNVRWSVAGDSTNFFPASNRVFAAFSPVVPLGIGENNTATAWLDNGFSLRSSGGPTFSNVEISVNYELFAELAADFAYEVGSELTLSVLNASGDVMASVNLYESNRQGDTGVTDVNTGGGTRFSDGGASVQVLLRAPGAYTLRFTAEAYGSAFLVGVPAAWIDVTLRNLRIRVDEDEFGLLQDHDAAIRNLIATHDAEIKAAVAQHDMDIKALLMNLQAGQQEIIRLLLTPQGLRQSDFGDCAGSGCDFPLNPADPPVAVPAGPPAPPAANTELPTKPRDLRRGLRENGNGGP
jgi:hypothetical protein